MSTFTVFPMLMTADQNAQYDLIDSKTREHITYQILSKNTPDDSYIFVISTTNINNILIYLSSRYYPNSRERKTYIICDPTAGKKMELFEPHIIIITL